jgi:hypothetical protein
MKALPDELNLICNRVGVISSIHHQTDTIVITVMGKNNAVTHKAIKRKKTKPKNDNGKNGKTLERCECVHDYALVTFLDGGVSTYKEHSTWHQEAMRRDRELLDRQWRQGGRDDDDGSSSRASDSINSDEDDGGGDGDGVMSASRKRGRKQDKGDKKPKAKRTQSAASSSSKDKEKKKSRNSI